MVVSYFCVLNVGLVVVNFKQVCMFAIIHIGTSKLAAAHTIVLQTKLGEARMV
jgi:hypothetical protein